MAVYEKKDKKKQTKDGRKWYYRTYYTDMYGNRKQKVSKLYKTKLEAKEAESEFLINIKTNDETDLNISFESVCIEWLHYKKQLVKYTTFYGIEKKVKKHILSVFKKFQLHSIKTNQILLWKESKEKDKKLSPESLNKIIGYFQELLEYARVNYEFDIKVCGKLQKNKIGKRSNKVNEAEWNFWTYEEFTKFIEIVDDDYDKLTYNFLYFTGLRFSEMAGLCWKNVNLEKKTIKIIDNLTRAEGGGFELTDPKTNNSIRIVDLDDNLVELLKEHYEKEKQIYKFNNSMFVFGNVKYTALTTFSNHLEKYINKIDVKRITPHGFRHSHVSLLINLGCDSREVAERIGDTIQMVEKTYYHMFPEKRSNAVNILNNLKK